MTLVHRYWTGPAAPATWSGRALRQLNPQLRVVDWSDDTLPPECIAWVDAQRTVHPSDALRHRANLVRLWLLAEQGGWWVDHDVVMLRPFDTLPWPAIAAHRRSVCSCVMGFPPAHPMITSAMRLIEAERDLFPREGRSAVISGEVLLGRVTTPDVTWLQLPFDAAGAPIPDAEPWAVHTYSSQERGRR